MHSCRKLVEHVGFFQNLPTPLILRIVSALTIEVYMVNDVIVKIGTPGVCMYFIASGCVAIYTRNGYEVCPVITLPSSTSLFHFTFFPVGVSSRRWRIFRGVFSVKAAGA